MNRETIGRPMEILLVEDSLSSARLTIGRLKNGPVPHRMTWLSDGAEALEFLERGGKFSHAPRPDLILLDLGLPNVDGRELLKYIRGNAELQSIPVVVLTASTDEKDVAQSERLHVERYMIKPIDYAEFLRLLKDFSHCWRSDMILPQDSETAPHTTSANR